MSTPPSQVGDTPANRRAPCRARDREERTGEKRDEGRDVGKINMKIVCLTSSGVFIYR